VAAHLIQATQKIRVSLTTYFYHDITLTFDLDLEIEVPAIVGQLYKRFYIDVRPVEGVNAEQKCIQKNILSNISCKNLAFAR
jgi:hypothetical protein